MTVIFILRSQSSRSRLTLQRRKQWAENSWECCWLQYFWIHIYKYLSTPFNPCRCWISWNSWLFSVWKFEVPALPVHLCGFGVWIKQESRPSQGAQRSPGGRGDGAMCVSLRLCAEPPDGVLLWVREGQSVRVLSQPHLLIKATNRPCDAPQFHKSRWCVEKRKWQSV